MFTDVDPNQWVLTPEIARAVMHHTRIDAVNASCSHTAELPIEDWDKFAIEMNVPVIVDAAAALGSKLLDEILRWHLVCTRPSHLASEKGALSHDRQFFH